MRGSARAEAPAEPGPLRTCVGCRRVRSQDALLRLVRTAEGDVAPDPARRRGGRGAYVCRSESCLGEAVRRSRWAHAFRAPAVLRPETVERIRTLIRAEHDRERGVRPGESGGDTPVGVGGRSGVPVKGGW